MEAITDHATLESELADLSSLMSLSADNHAGAYADPSISEPLDIKDQLLEMKSVVLPQKKKAEKATENYIDRAPRHVAHWKIAIVYDDGVGEKEIYYGKTYEVSLTGASILTDHNVFIEGNVHILLALPWYKGKKKEMLIEIKGRMVYTILGHEGHQFRTGLEFLSFKKDDVQYLDRALQSRRRIEKAEKYFSMGV